MSDKKLEQQLAQTNAAVMQLQRQIQHQFNQNHGGGDYDEYDDYDAPPPGYQQQDPYGESVDTNKLVLQAITNQAAAQATQAVRHQQAAAQAVNQNVTNRMKRLVTDFPSLSDEGSDLTQKARQIYSRVSHENPSLDQATRYELAVREAAAAIGARPLSTPPEAMADWTMGSTHNPAALSKSTRSRLTPEIIMNAKLMNINVDPKTKQGQQNLRELSEYSARFNADVDESHYKYR